MDNKVDVCGCETQAPSFWHVSLPWWTGPSPPVTSVPTDAPVTHAPAHGAVPSDNQAQPALPVCGGSQRI